MSDDQPPDLYRDDLVCGSAESMRELEDGCVTLTVTSPPYFNAIDYDRFAASPGSNYRTRAYSKGFDGYDSYLALMTRIFGEVYRVTRPGGYTAIVAGSIQDEGRCRPIPFDLAQRMQMIGWEHWHEIVWHKGASALDRAGSFVLRPFPDYFHPNVTHEHVLLFRKPGPRLRSQMDEPLRQGARVPLSPLVKRDVLNSTWHVVTMRKGEVDHPCPFPEELTHRLIALYSHPGDLVLDPFLGSGQTTKVARALGRKYFGYDLEQAFVDLARKRLDEPLRLRRKQLWSRFEHIEDDEFLQLGQSIRPWEDRDR